MSRQLKPWERRIVQWSIWGWCGGLVAVPLAFAFVAYIDKELRDNVVFTLLVFGLPSLGLLVAASGVLKHGKRALFSLRVTEAEQERQLKRISTLAGVHGGLGLAFNATIAIFEQTRLTDHLLLSSLSWVAFAFVYFVAFWGLGRIEADERPNNGEY